MEIFGCLSLRKINLVNRYLSGNKSADGTMGGMIGAGA